MVKFRPFYRDFSAKKALDQEIARGKFGQNSVIFKIDVTRSFLGFFHDFFCGASFHIYVWGEDEIFLKNYHFCHFHRGGGIRPPPGA